MSAYEKRWPKIKKLLVVEIRPQNARSKIFFTHRQKLVKWKKAGSFTPISGSSIKRGLSSSLCLVSIKGSKAFKQHNPKILDVTHYKHSQESLP